MSGIGGRREFLLAGAATATLPWGIGELLGMRDNSSRFGNRNELSETFPITDAARAREIVGVSHFNLERVEKLLAEDASLARATWDWGFGDWESALGAASHTGQIAIIEKLIAYGARPNLFTLATLDKVDAVRAVCESIPDVHRIHGPHGITLYRHAQAGKAERVIEYLDSIGGANEGVASEDLSAEQATPYLGQYRFGESESEFFTVQFNERLSRLAIERSGLTAINMARVSGDEFTLYASPQVRIRFEIKGDAATSLVIERAGFRLEAQRG